MQDDGTKEKGMFVLPVEMQLSNGACRFFCSAGVMAAAVAVLAPELLPPVPPCKEAPRRANTAQYSTQRNDSFNTSRSLLCMTNVF